MPAAARPSPLFVLVLGHTRPWALRCVLEGLRREGALERTEVWLDGHSDHVFLKPKVLACQALADAFPACRFVPYINAVGHPRRMLEALDDVLERHERVLVLEDDCFPAPGALAALDRSLRSIEDDPGWFSVYGDPLGLPGEAEGTWLFRPWGWASTRAKLRPVLDELAAVQRLPERKLRAWMREAVGSRPADRPFVATGQMEAAIYMDRFQWDIVLPLLLGARGMRNRVTPERVLWNFGLGPDSWHLVGSDARYLEPPFNMITPHQLTRRFGLEVPELAARHDIELQRTYRLVAGGDDARLLEAGWGGPEPWGTWAVNPEARLRLRLPAGRKPRRRTLEILTRAEVLDPTRPVRVGVSVSGRPGATWTYQRSRRAVLRRLKLPAVIGGERDPIELAFRIEGAASPASRGLSADERELGFGLVELRVR